MSDRIGIVVPLDGSQTATAAIPAAIAIARIMKAEIHVLHIIDEPLPEEKLLEKLSISDLACTHEFILHQESGDVVAKVTSFADQKNIKMIVMSSHGQTYDPDALSGHITLGIIQSSLDPVMVVRPDMKGLPDVSWRPRRMLVPLDGSPAAAAGMKKMMELAELVGLAVDLVHIAVLGKEPPGARGTMVSPPYLDYPQYEWQAWAQEFMVRFTRNPPKVEVRIYHREGKPSEEMLRMAVESEEDIIMLAWQGVMEGERAAVIKEILRRTELPVILIKTG